MNWLLGKSRLIFVLSVLATRKQLPGQSCPRRVRSSRRSGFTANDLRYAHVRQAHSSRRKEILIVENLASSTPQLKTRTCNLTIFVSSYSGQSTFELLLNLLTFHFTFASLTCFYMRTTDVGRVVLLQPPELRHEGGGG